MGLIRTITRKIRRKTYARRKVSLSELKVSGEASFKTHDTLLANDNAGRSPMGLATQSLKRATVITPGHKNERPRVTSSRPHARIRKALKELAEQTSNAS